MARTPAKYSFARIANISCGSSRAKDNFFLLNKCVVQVKNHLRSCNLSRTKVTEYDLIWQGRESLILLKNKYEKDGGLSCLYAQPWYNYTGGQVKLSVYLSWP